MPIYEEKEKVNGQKRYYIRTYITDDSGKKKQITKHNKNWIGRDGYWLAYQEESQLKNKKYSSYDHVTLKEVVDKYINEITTYNKESTVYSHISVIKNNINPFFQGNQKVYDIEESDIIEWHEWLNRKNLSIKYKRKSHMIMSSIIDTAIKFYKLRYNVAKNVGNFKEIALEKEKINNQNKLRYITYDEFQKFINCVDSYFWNTFFNFVYFTGMRKGEIQALCWNDIDFEKKCIYVTKNLTVKTNTCKWKITSTKNFKNRKIDMDDNLLNIMKTFFMNRKENEEFNMTHFVFGGKEPLKQHKIDINKDKYFKKSGIRRITIHEFRHSHISFLINEYVKGGQTDSAKFFIMASTRMGHSIEVMQSTYLHLFDDIQNEIIKLINNKNALYLQDQKQDQRK